MGPIEPARSEVAALTQAQGIVHSLQTLLHRSMWVTLPDRLCIGSQILINKRLIPAKLEKGGFLAFGCLSNTNQPQRRDDQCAQQFLSQTTSMSFAQRL